MLAFEGGFILGPQAPHDLDCLRQHADPNRWLGELVAVPDVLVLIPAGADPHLDPPAGDRVDRSRNFGQVGRRAVRVAGAHLAQPHGFGCDRQGSHHRPSLVCGLLGTDRDGVEVVVHPHRLVAGGFGGAGDVRHCLPMPLGIDVDQIEPPSLRDEASKPHEFLSIAQLPGDATLPHEVRRCIARKVRGPWRTAQAWQSPGLSRRHQLPNRRALMSLQVGQTG